MCVFFPVTCSTSSLARDEYFVSRNQPVSPPAHISIPIPDILASQIGLYSRTASVFDKYTPSATYALASKRRRKRTYLYRSSNPQLSLNRFDFALYRPDKRGAVDMYLCMLNHRSEKTQRETSMSEPLRVDVGNIYICIYTAH